MVILVSMHRVIWPWMRLEDGTVLVDDDVLICFDSGAFVGLLLDGNGFCSIGTYLPWNIHILCHVSTATVVVTDRGCARHCVLRRSCLCAGNM